MFLGKKAQSSLWFLLFLYILLNFRQTQQKKTKFCLSKSGYFYSIGPKTSKMLAGLHRSAQTVEHRQHRRASATESTDGGTSCIKLRGPILCKISWKLTKFWIFNCSAMKIFWILSYISDLITFSNKKT